MRVAWMASGACTSGSTAPPWDAMCKDPGGCGTTSTASAEGATEAMPMPGGTMSMAWMPMCGQSWIGAAASFLGMWTVMMVPSLAPQLWRYRQSVGRAGGLASVLLTLLVAGGYFLVWTLIGAAIYPLGAATMAVTMRYPVLANAVPIAIGLVVLGAGVLQFTGWKAHHLACCRNDCGRASLRCGRASPVTPFTAWRDGLRLGFHCGQCC